MKRVQPIWHVAAAALLGALPLSVGTAAADSAHEAPAIVRQDWSFGGFTGQYDQAQLQRGFQIYQQVCSGCHGLKRVRFRNLAEPGGPQFPEESVKALAKEWPNKISGELDDQGNPIDRLPGLPDPILGPYKNDVQARAAQNGALPPDLSLIAKARNAEQPSAWYNQWLFMLRDIAIGYQEGGPDYLYALLTGYLEPPAGFHMTEGMNYNAAFPGHQIAMPPPLSKDGPFEYQPESGVKGSLEQNAHDISAFLAWAADPHLDGRKRLGWQVLLYLFITTILLFLVKKKIWANVKH